MKKIFLLSLLFIGFLGKTSGQSYTSTIVSGINEIAGTGTAVTLTASVSSSTSSGSLPIGFTFNFYGNSYTNFYINPTGTLSFGSANQNYLGNNVIPSTNAPNNFIGFAFINPYDNYPSPNLYPNYNSSNINYFTSGTAPNRILVVNFKNVVIPPSFPIASRTLNVQVQLSENDGKIEVHNTTSFAPYAPDYGRYDYLQIGVENIDGTNGTAATCRQNWNLNNQTVRFTYCSAVIPTNVTSNTAICNATSQQTVNLSATCSAGTVVWYKDDGNCISSTGTLLTSTSVSPTVTTTYKARCEGGACNSGFVNTKITVTNTNPSVPNAISKSPATNPISAGTSVTLSTYCSSGYYKWDDNSNLFQRVVTPNQTTTYNVKCLNGACESANVNTTVNVTANSVPAPVISSPTNDACAGTNATLTATGCTSTDVVTWYLSGNATSLGTGTTKIVNLTTTSASVVNSYYATCTQNGVISVNSNYKNIAVYNPASPTSITKNPSTDVNPYTSVQLTATCTSGNTIKWEDNSTPNPRTVVPAVTTNYSAKCVNATCESSSTSTIITVNSISISNTTPTVTCQAPGTTVPVTFTAIGSFAGNFQIQLWQHRVRAPYVNTNNTIQTVASAASPATLTLGANLPITGFNGIDTYYDYYITVTDYYGAVTSLNYPITLSAPPVLTISSTTASPATINYGGSLTLTASGCSGGAIVWSNGGATTTTLTVSPTTNTNYTFVCTVAPCVVTSPQFSIIVTPPPCPPNLTLVSTADDITTGTITKQASATAGTITATNKITGTGTKATYQAKSINLNAGFKADNGTVFKAEIGGCN